jgi:hypothetical protein
MLRRSRYVILLWAVSVFTGGCPFMGLAYKEDLVDGYAVWATDVIEQAAVVYKDKDGPGAVEVVPASVFAYAWNDQFIVAKQHPQKDGIVEAGTTYWYVVEVASRRVHGPLSEGEFQDLKVRLGIPVQLSFRTVR